MWSSLAALLFATATVAAGTTEQASNFPVSPEVAAQYGCGKTCQESLNQANSKDLGDFNTPFDFDFYATANNFSNSKPGDLLKLSPVDTDLLDVPAGIATYKIQYTSVDLDNSTIPATAFVSFPFVQQGGPFKLVAFAHGTSGVFRGCAPSTSSSLFDYDTLIPLLFSGYAVVGTDYAGLGNNYKSHKYISAKANANDVYWSTIAARKAFPHRLSEKWVSIGHSQGGGASWKLSEHELVQTTTSGYLGGVAVAPNTHIYNAVVEGMDKLEASFGEETRSPGFFSYIPSVYFALRAVFPNYTATWLSNMAQGRIKLGNHAQLCASALPVVLQGLNTSQVMTKVDPSGLAPIKEFQDMNAPAQGDKAARPLLVISGANDTTVFPGITTKAYKKSCKAGNIVHLSIYPGLEHSPVFGASAPEWLGFINDLFHGYGFSNCSMATVRAFDMIHANTPEEE
ncbi:Alpha/Beta hydrolase protein [Aspergillus aurantiobrunneus]